MIQPKFQLNQSLMNTAFIQNLLNKIEFRYIDNMMSREESFLYSTLHRILPKKIKDIANIKIKEKGILLKYLKVINVEKMATFGTFFIINSICRNIKNGSFLNIGVWNGFSLFSGMIDTDCEVVGVDNFSEFRAKEAEKNFFSKFNKLKKKNHYFYKQDALHFLNNCEKKFDFYYYDALHTYEYQLKSLQLADKILKKNALILIDDISWNYSDDPLKATQDFLKLNENKYKLLLDIRTKYNRHPTFWNGLFLIEKVV